MTLAEVGRAEVTATGAFSTSVPITVPKYFGITPQLALSYNSNAGLAEAGRGWSLTGLSAIVRSGPNHGAPKYDGKPTESATTDVFYLDGQELLPCSNQVIMAGVSPSCTDFGTHSAKIEDFRRYKFSELYNSWTIWEKNGTKSVYSAIMARSNLVGMSLETSHWALSTVEDTHGNKVTYSYLCGDECYIDKITYGEGSFCAASPPPVPPDSGLSYRNGNIIPGAEIKFYWGPTRGPQGSIGTTSSYGNGDRIVTVDRLLKTIDVKFSNFHQRTYSLHYVPSQNDLFQCLQTIQEFGSDVVLDSFGTVLAGTRARPTTYTTPASTTPIGGYSYSTNLILNSVGGHSDTSMVPYSYSNAPYSYGLLPYGADSVLTADPGICTSNLCGIPGYTPESDSGTLAQWFAADLDGDGRVDMIGLSQWGGAPGSPWRLKLRTMMNRPDGWVVNENALATSWAFATDAQPGERYRFLVSDVNGDHKADFTMITNNLESVGSNVTIHTAISNGDGTFTDYGYHSNAAFKGWRWGDPNGDLAKRLWDKFQIGDVNGDGLADIIDIVPRYEACTTGPGGNATWAGCDPTLPNWPLNVCIRTELVVGISRGDGQYDVTSQLTQWPSPPVFDGTWFVGDVNGDGKSDIVNVFDYVRSGPAATVGYENLSNHILMSSSGLPWAMGIRTAVGRGDGSFDVKADFLTDYQFKLPVSSLFASPQHSRGNIVQIGDFNGDGRMDIVAYRPACVGANCSLDTCRDTAGGDPLAPPGAVPPEPCTPVVIEYAVAFSDDGNGKYYVAPPVSTGLGEAFHNAIYGMRWPQNSAYHGNHWSVADVNGDGMDDIVAATVFTNDAGASNGNPASLFRGMSDGAGTFNFKKKDPPGWDLSCNRSGSNYAPCDWLPVQTIVPGDVNGDGRADVIYVGTITDYLGDVLVKVRTDTSDNTGEDQLWRSADVNGDGRMDLIYMRYLNPGYSAHVMLNNGDSPTSYTRWPAETVNTTTPSSTALDNPAAPLWHLADVGERSTGALDGKADLVFIDHRTSVTPPELEIHTAFASSNNTPTTPPPLFSTALLSQSIPLTGVLAGEFPVGYVARNWLEGDFNGDGMTDFVNISHEQGTAYTHVLRATPKFGQFAPSWTYHARQGYRFIPFEDALTNRTAFHWKVMDVNGDGKSDLVLVHTQNGNTVIRTLLSTSSGTTIKFEPKNDIAVGVAFPDPQRWMPFSANNDRLTDLAYVEYSLSTKTFLLHTLRSLGNGKWTYVASGNPIVSNAAIASFADARNFIPTDINEDGVSDLVRIFSYREPSSNPDGLANRRDGIDRIINRQGVDELYDERMQLSGTVHTASKRWLRADVNVDGKSDFLYFPNGSGVVQSLAMVTADERLSEVNNGKGGVTTVNYGTSAGKNDGIAPPPHGTLLKLVTSVGKQDVLHGLDNTSPGTTNFPATTYFYGGLTYSLAQHRILGFRTRQMQDNLSLTHEQYELTDQCGLRLNIHYDLDPSVYDPAVAISAQPKALLSKFTFVFTPKGTSVTNPSTCELSTKYDYECEGATPCLQNRTDFLYDTYGNLSETDVWGRHADPFPSTTEDRKIETQFYYNTSAYIVGLPAATTTSLWNAVTLQWDRQASTMNIYDQPTGLNWALPPGPKAEIKKTLVWNSHQEASEPTDKIATAYDYDSFGNVTKVTGPTGIYLTTDYDCNYNRYAVSSCNNLKQCASLGWDVAHGLLMSYTGVNKGDVTSFSYDPLGRLSLKVNPDKTSVSTFYLDYGKPDQRIQTRTSDDSTGRKWAGYHWSEEYFDGLGHIYKVKSEGARPIEGDTVSIEYTFADASNRLNSVSSPHKASEPLLITTQAYDALKRPTITTFPDSATKTNVYSIGSLLTSDELGHGRKFFHDVNGRIVQVQEANRACTYVNSDSICGPPTTYDTFYDYDAFNRVTKITDSMGNTTTNTFNSLGWTMQSTDWDLGTSIYAYNLDGSMKKSTDARGFSKTYDYDSIGRPTVIKYINNSSPPTVTRKVTKSYDLAPLTHAAQGASIGRLVEIDDTTTAKYVGCYPLGPVYFTHQIGQANNYTIESCVAAAKAAGWSYAALQAGGYCFGGASVPTRVADSECNTPCTANALEVCGGTGRNSVYATGDSHTVIDVPYYDIMGRAYQQKRCIDGSCAEMSETYNAAGQTKTLTYPDRETLIYSYNGAGWLKSISNFVTNTAYNSLGQITSSLYKNNVSTTFSYDQYRFWPKGMAVSAGAYSATYTHDLAGRIRSRNQTNPEEDAYYDYDDLDRLRKVTSVPSLAQVFDYDQVGNMTFNSKMGTYKYDDPLHKHAVTSTSGITALNFSWLVTSCPTGSSRIKFFINGQVALARATDTSCGCSVPIGTASITDAAVISLITSGANTFSVEFPGTAQRLAWAQVDIVGGPGNVVIYDANGQTGVQSRTDLCAPSPGYTTTLLTQSQSVTITPTLYTCDASGNMVSGGSQTYSNWDNDQRMTRSTASGKTTDYTYDVSGQRVIKAASAPGSGILPHAVSTTLSTKYFNKYYELNGSNTATKYYYAGGQLVAKRDPSHGITYYHQDHLGSTRVVTDATGAAAGSPNSYPAFGKATTSQRFGFALAESDDETGLLYMKARHENPDLGRMLSADTVIPDLFNPQSLNRYSYVLNNPTMYNDASGHGEEKAWDVGDWSDPKFEWNYPTGETMVHGTRDQQIEFSDSEGEMFYSGRARDRTNSFFDNMERGDSVATPTAQRSDLLETNPGYIGQNPFNFIDPTGSGYWDFNFSWGSGFGPGVTFGVQKDVGGGSHPYAGVGFSTSGPSGSVNFAPGQSVTPGRNICMGGNTPNFIGPFGVGGQVGLGEGVPFWEVGVSVGQGPGFGLWGMYVFEEFESGSPSPETMRFVDKHGYFPGASAKLK